MVIETDRSGFPLVRIDEVGLWVHWLPVTKIQFEHYLCESEDDRFDQRWYEEVLALNPRISPHQVNAGNYWRSFLTGILPGEVDGFARWCGESMRLPSADEWVRIYRALADQPPLDPEEMPFHDGDDGDGGDEGDEGDGGDGGDGGAGERHRVLLRKLDEAVAAAARKVGYGSTRATQMLLRLGVMEWTTAPDAPQGWAGFGETHPGFQGMLRNPDDAARPNRGATHRIGYYGLRLVREV